MVTADERFFNALQSDSLAVHLCWVEAGIGWKAIAFFLKLQFCFFLGLAFGFHSTDVGKFPHILNGNNREP